MEMWLVERLKSYRLLLGSQSPRRRELLTEAGIPFELALPYACEETYPEGMPPTRVAGYLSRLKSHAYPHPLGPKDILLTADTVVVLDDEILGKPKSEVEAFEMLKKLSGRTHRVVTGMTLRGLGREKTVSVSTRVRFSHFSDPMLHFYIKNYRPFDKAGAYGIQEWLGYVGVEHISGSFFNVMGLPVQRLYTALEALIL